MRRLWTDGEDAYLREHYVARGRVACADALRRSAQAISDRASHLGLIRNRRWTPAEDARLTMAWGVQPIEAIATSFGRPIGGIYLRAAALDLGRGCPQGHETIHQAAQRCGFDPSTMMGVLRWAHVRVDRAWTRNGANARARVVESADVDDAVARWCSTEPLTCVAERLGIAPETLRRILSAAIVRGDDRVPLPPRGAHRPWRLPFELCAELMAHDRRLETLSEASRRVGHGVRALAKALRAAGIPSGRGVRLRQEEVDRVSAGMPNRRRRPVPHMRAA